MFGPDVLFGKIYLSVFDNCYLVKQIIIDIYPCGTFCRAQVVGWPPVRSFRKNIVSGQKKSSDEPADHKAAAVPTSSAAFVKVSMDGAPYLRKVDLKLYKSYPELSDALAKLFSSFTIGIISNYFDQVN